MIELGWRGLLPAPLNFHTLPPCRAVDTRNAPGPAGGPALAANSTRAFVLSGRCGIPASGARDLAERHCGPARSGGTLARLPRIGRADRRFAINYGAGQTRANNAITGLGASGEISVRCVQAAGSAHLILDVNGYFE